MRDVALHGESAGGALTASAVLNLRDQGKGLPAWRPLAIAAKLDV